MIAKVNLHAHDSRVSWDSTTPPELMARAYDRLGFDAVGFVGHGEMSEFESDRILVLNGIEREISKDPEIHIVEYPRIEFSFLAHPQRMDMDNTKDAAREVISDLGLDGVEKFSNGQKQYSGSISSIEVGNDDAHNLLQMGTSYMEMNVNEVNTGQIVQALKRRDFRIKNRRRRWLGQAVKNINAGVGLIRK